jgi:hypothetical protein
LERLNGRRRPFAVAGPLPFVAGVALTSNFCELLPGCHSCPLCQAFPPREMT